MDILYKRCFSICTHFNKFRKYFCLYIYNNLVNIYCICYYLLYDLNQEDNTCIINLTNDSLIYIISMPHKFNIYHNYLNIISKY